MSFRPSLLASLVARAGARRKNGPARPALARGAGEGGQLIILIGFITAIALVALTLMLSDVIYASNSASIETLRPERSEIEEVARLVKNEINYVRKAYSTGSDIDAHMANFSRNLSLLFAARGVAVEMNWSGALAFGSAIINSSDAIAYCGDKAKDRDVNLWNWMQELGLNVTDYTYQDKCEKLKDGGTWRRPALLFQELCRGGSATENQNCSNDGSPGFGRNYDALVFDWHKLEPEPNTTTPYQCGDKPDKGVINHSNCRALRNFTAMGGKVVITSEEPNLEDNRTLIDVLTDNFNNYGPGGATTNANRNPGDNDHPHGGFITNISPLLKNYQVGDKVTFGGQDFAFPWTSDLQIYICHPGDYDAATQSCTRGTQRGTSVSWRYGAGAVYYVPRLKGDLERSGNKILHDDLRPLFNLFAPGGACSVLLQVRDGTTTYNATINC